METFIIQGVSSTRPEVQPRASLQERRETMTRTALRVVECCSICRKPVERCESLACQKATTYPGIMVRGTWQNVECHAPASSDRELAGASA
jgi:hypothetical protein